MRVHKLMLTGLTALAGALGGQLALAAGPAAALQGYPAAPNIVFGASGAGNGQFSSPAGVAVDDSSGDVYVADQGNNRVERFDAEGGYLSQFNGSDNPSFPEGFSAPTGIAVDNSTGPSKGDVYVIDQGHHAIDKFSSTGTFLFELKGYENAFAVTVDSSGNVWAATRFEGESVPVNGFQEFSDAEENELLRAEHPRLYPFAGIAVDSEESLYLFTTTEGNRFVEKWPHGHGATGKEVAACCATALALDTATNGVFVDEGSSIAEFGPFGEPYLSPVQTFGTGFSSEAGISTSEGIAVNSKTGTVYASQRAGDTVAVFKAALFPDVATGVAVVQRTSAKLEGVVNPSGREVTLCQIEFGTSTSYGQTAPCASAPGSGSSPVTVSAQAGGLALETSYHYRLVAGNSNGVNLGEDHTFTTFGAVPELHTEAATSVEQPAAQTVATLNASFNPDGADTHYYFEYGETEEYGSVSPALPGADAGEGVELEHVHTQVVGLRPSTLYHYRIVGVDSFGTSTGADMTFITPVLIPPAPVVGGLPASDLSQFGATLNGTIQTGEGLVNYRFEYGTSTAYGQVAPIPDNYTPITSETLPVSQPVQGLQAGTTYHYRLVVSSPGATAMKGPDETFTTLPIPAPTVSTGSPSGVSVGSVTLSGTIDPHAWNTEYLFQYGTSTAYGSSWPTVEVEMGALEGSQAVIVGVPNLLPGTTYHYRLVASNGGGTTYGQDMTFTTGEYPAQIIQEPVALQTLLVPTGGQTAKPQSTVLAGLGD